MVYTSQRDSLDGVKPGSLSSLITASVGALLVCSTSVTGRETTSFDLGWKFQLGDGGYEQGCNTSAFTTNFSTTICAGAEEVFVSSAELCESACCGNPDCTSWQYCEQPCKYVT